MRCLVFSKDSGKTVTPTGGYELQPFALHRDYWQSLPVALSLWLAVQYMAPEWGVSLQLYSLIFVIFGWGY